MATASYPALKGGRGRHKVVLVCVAMMLLPKWQIGPFTRPSEFNPLIEPNPKSAFDCPIRKEPVLWEELHTFNPAAAVFRGKVYLFYRAEDASGKMQVGGHTSRIGLATSTDGLHFRREPKPVLFPDNDDQKAREWPGGCEDPRVVEAPDGSFVMTYTQYNRTDVHLAVATSRDLRHWTKHGPAFTDVRYSKSGCILTRLQRGRLVAAKLHGRYWMFWGDSIVQLASSDDLIHWKAEAGAGAVLTEDGIVLIYNGKDHDTGVYCAGQALISAEDPFKLIEQPEEPFFKPEMPWEKTGQYQDGTTFAEGLVRFRGLWLLYYGCADSRVGVAVAKH